jgi:DNA helicase-2/ATP-dependent DNA helicase PcrA
MRRPSFGDRPSNYYRVVEARAKRFEDGTEVYVPVGQGRDAPEVGSRVFHQKFGYGQVQAIDGNKLDIAFDKAGAKKVMAEFVKPV